MKLIIINWWKKKQLKLQLKKEYKKLLKADNDSSNIQMKINITPDSVDWQWVKLWWNSDEWNICKNE